MLDLITAITGEDAGNLPLNELESWTNKLTFLDKPYNKGRRDIERKLRRFKNANS